jgi:hypothetical protein
MISYRVLNEQPDNDTSFGMADSYIYIYYSNFKQSSRTAHSGATNLQSY